MEDFIAQWTDQYIFFEPVIARWLLHDAREYAWINNRPINFNGAEYAMFISMVRLYRVWQK